MTSWSLSGPAGPAISKGGRHLGAPHPAPRPALRLAPSAAGYAAVEPTEGTTQVDAQLSRSRGPPVMLAPEDDLGALSGEPIHFHLPHVQVRGQRERCPAQLITMPAWRPSAEMAVAPAHSSGFSTFGGRPNTTGAQNPVRITKCWIMPGSRGCREGLLRVVGFEVGILTDLVRDGLANRDGRIRTGGDGDSGSPPSPGGRSKRIPRNRVREPFGVAELRQPPLRSQLFRSREPRPRNKHRHAMTEKPGREPARTSAAV